MDTPTPVKNQATTEPGGSPPGYLNDTSTPHTQQEAVGRPLDTTMIMNGQSLLGHCPWLSSVRNRLLERLVWTTQPTGSLHGRDILLLYTGRSDGGALDDILIQQHLVLLQLIFLWVDDLYVYLQWAPYHAASIRTVMRLPAQFPCLNLPLCQCQMHHRSWSSGIW